MVGVTGLEPTASTTPKFKHSLKFLINSLFMRFLPLSISQNNILFYKNVRTFARTTSGVYSCIFKAFLSASILL